MKCSNHAQPFDTLESAQEFISLLHQSIRETLDDIQNDLSAALTGQIQHRVQVLELATFKLNQLSSHVITAERLLKDLHTLRDLLYKDLKADSSTTRRDAMFESLEIGVG